MSWKDVVVSAFAPLVNIASYHLLLYSMLLGTELYQSFVMTKVCYNALPMSAFTTLQKRVFPVYFKIQSALILLTAVTFPPYGPFSLVFSTGDAITIGFTGAMAMLNLTIYGPRTQQAMIERTHQQTREGRSHDDPGEPSEEMIKKRKAFSHNHAMSIHLNLLAMGTTVCSYTVRNLSSSKAAASASKNALEVAGRFASRITISDGLYEAIEIGITPYEYGARLSRLAMLSQRGTSATLVVRVWTDTTLNLKDNHNIDKRG